MSQLTTHILDTSQGKPANGVHVMLFRHKGEKWIQLANAHTDEDGRIPGLLKKGNRMTLGTYKLRFEVQNYYARQGVQTLYPYIEISFQVTTNDHYHIPLLVSPFGYSTYRGS
jgi:5-hydroxyisourate hydrolase